MRNKELYETVNIRIVCCLPRTKLRKKDVFGWLVALCTKNCKTGFK